MQYFLDEYRDMVYEAPFQFPADMLFIMRAMGILSGMATNLDSEFDPWAETMPFAEKLASEQFKQEWQGWGQELIKIGQYLLFLHHPESTLEFGYTNYFLHSSNSFAVKYISHYVFYHISGGCV